MIGIWKGVGLTQGQKGSSVRWFKMAQMVHFANAGHKCQTEKYCNQDGSPVNRGRLLAELNRVKFFTPLSQVLCKSWYLFCICKGFLKLRDSSSKTKIFADSSINFKGFQKMSTKIVVKYRLKRSHEGAATLKNKNAWIKRWHK